MAEVHRACGLLTVARGRQRKDQLDIGAELGLILFDNHDIIAALVHHGLGHMPLGAQRIHRDHAVLQDDRASHRLDLRDFVGLGVHCLLGERQTHVVGQGRQQMDPRGSLLLGTP